MSDRFVKLDPTFYRHRKTLRLRRMIGDAALWVPPRLWADCVERATGDVSDFNGEDLAAVLGYEGDGEKLKAALIEVGFISTDGKTVEGWDERYGQVFAFYRSRAKKAADARWGNTAPQQTEIDKKTEKIEEIREEGASLKNASSIDEASPPNAVALSPENKGADAPRALKRPTLQQWIEYGQQLEAAWPSDDAQNAFDHYAANGWKQSNGNVIKDWQAACRTCIGFWRKRPTTPKRDGTNPHQRPAPTAEDHARGW